MGDYLCVYMCVCCVCVCVCVCVCACVCVLIVVTLKKCSCYLSTYFLTKHIFVLIIRRMLC